MFKIYCLFGFVLFSLLSCSGSKLVKSESTTAKSILFFKVDPPKNGKLQVYPTALAQGYLVLRGNCLYLKPNQSNNEGLFGVIWPWDYSLKVVGNHVTVVNGLQKHIADIGDYIKLGGAASTMAIVVNKYDACNSINIKSVFVGNPVLAKNK